MTVGLYLDAWAHIRGLPENFFTPWHSILYSDFLAGAIAAIAAWRRVAEGGPLVKTMLRT